MVILNVRLTTPGWPGMVSQRPPVVIGDHQGDERRQPRRSLIRGT